MLYYSVYNYVVFVDGIIYHYIHIFLTTTLKVEIPKFAGSNPAEAVGFFGRKNPQHAFLRRGSKRICTMSQLCGM